MKTIALGSTATVRKNTKPSDSCEADFVVRDANGCEIAIIDVKRWSLSLPEVPETAEELYGLRQRLNDAINHANLTDERAQAVRTRLTALLLKQHMSIRRASEAHEAGHAEIHARGDADLVPLPANADLAPRAARIFEVLSRVVKRAHIEDEIGDALEEIHRMIQQGAPRWEVWLRIGGGVFWTCVNAMREIRRAWQGKKTGS
jgi:hypothetical protein